MKLKLNIKKLLINSLILCGSLSLTLNIESYAIDRNLDLTRKSIVRNFGGSNNDCFNSVIETKDRGIVAVGYSDSTNAGFTNKGNYDSVIVKYDGEGNQQWVKNFGGSNADYFNSVIETQDKGFVAVGYSDSINAGFTNKGNYDSVIVKYDSEGNQQWVKSFGGSEDEYFNSVIETSDKSLIVVGESGSVNAGFSNKGDIDAVVVKYDSEGNELWVKSLGGVSNDIFSSVVEASDNGFIAVGYSWSSDLGFTNKGNHDGIIVKYDKDGNQSWIKNFGGSSYDFFYSTTKTGDGGIVVTGYSQSTNAGFTNRGGYDAVIVKYDSEGNQQWVKSFGGSSDECFDSVTEMSDGGIVVTGYCQSTNAGFTNKGLRDGIIIKYDRDGNQLWIKNFGGSNFDILKSVAQINPGGVIVAGYSRSIDAGFNSEGFLDAIIVKYNQDCKDNEHIFDEVYSLESVDISIDNSQKLEETRGLVNNIENEELRNYLNEKLDSFNIGFGKLELKTVSANLDVYIKCENMLLMSLDTNSVTFEDFSGVEDVEKTNAVNVMINSSLPYQLNAYLPIEIQNSDKSNIMDKRILNIKENSETDYKEFTNLNEKVVLKDNCPTGNDLVHGVDIKLKGGLAFEKDVYKTTIKFEVEQK